MHVPGFVARYTLTWYDLCDSYTLPRDGSVGYAWSIHMPQPADLRDLGRTDHDIIDVWNNTTPPVDHARRSTKLDICHLVFVNCWLAGMG